MYSLRELALLAAAFSKNIDCLKLLGHDYNVCRYNGIDTVGKLYEEVVSGEIKRRRGVGTKTLDSLKVRLAKYINDAFMKAGHELSAEEVAQLMEEDKAWKRR